MLDTLVVSMDQVQQVKLGKYLIEIESEWKEPQLMPLQTNAAAITAGGGLQASSTLKKSNGMEKLLNKKFQKPAKYVPTSKQNSTMARKRPLQPGEYLRQFNGGGVGGSVSGGNIHGGNAQMVLWGIMGIKSWAVLIMDIRKLGTVACRCK